MLLTREAVVCVAEELTNFPELPLVVDPVMVSTSGHSLLEHDAVYAISDLLFPVASVITPNIPEAEVLSGITIDSAAGMEMAAKTITRRFGIKGAVLIKGGHLPDIQNGLVRDLLFLQNNYTWFEAPFIQTQSTHGTGCTLSAAITASLARGKSTESSVRIAKNYLTHALENGWKGLGRGKGSLKHNFKSGKIAE
jgi:hydroxymethylpyrimidine/phosphomethylpyrimidine kinase